MAEFVYINNYTQRGKLAISQNVFDELVLVALHNLGISTSKTVSKTKHLRLNRPVCTTIKKGIIHVWMAVDVEKSANIQDVSKEICDEITRIFMTYTDQVPFDVNVKIENLI